MTEPTPTPEQLAAGLCKALCLDLQDLKTFLELMPTVQPWQKDWLIKMTNERVNEMREAKMLRSLLEHKLDLGMDVKHEVSTKLVLPPGYEVRFYERRQGFMLYQKKSRVIQAGETCWKTEEEAIFAAYEHDRDCDRYRWRSISQTCPDQTMLQFSCADWAHSVILGKPVPVQTGYRNGDRLKILGASWMPTHWCYQPEPPPVVVAQTSSERH